MPLKPGKPYHVGFGCEHRLEMRGMQGHAEAGVVAPCGSLQRAAGPLEYLGQAMAFGKVATAPKEHVLEKVRQTPLYRGFMSRAAAHHERHRGRMEMGLIDRHNGQAIAQCAAVVC